MMPTAVRLFICASECPLLPLFAGLQRSSHSSCYLNAPNDAAVTSSGRRTTGTPHPQCAALAPSHTSAIILALLTQFVNVTGYAPQAMLPGIAEDAGTRKLHPCSRECGHKQRRAAWTSAAAVGPQVIARELLEG